MKKNLSFIEAKEIANKIFKSKYRNIFNREQLNNIDLGHSNSIGPFVDNTGNRSILSSDQINFLKNKGLIKKEVSNKRIDLVALYIHELSNLNSIKYEGEDDFLDCSANSLSIEILTILIKRDTGELVENWVKDW